MSVNPRKISADIIYNVTKKSASLGAQIDKCRSSGALTELDMRFVTELTAGTLRKLELLDFLILASSDISIGKISPYVLAVLRTGAYQLLFMDKIPQSAAVNECVKIIKSSSNNRLGGFVNAVLRCIARNGLGVKLPTDITKRLSVEYSCPEWIVKRWQARFGDEAEQLLASMSKKPATVIRPNTLRTTSGELINILRSEGWQCDIIETGLFKDMGLISASKIESLEKSEAYREGLFYVQDAAAAFASKALNPREGSFVIDMCASPGGKSTHMAQLMNNRGHILAFDIYDSKIKRIEENAARLGTDIISAERRDASVQIPELKGKADYILADVPCSGLGIIRRKPDIKYSRSESDIAALARISADILDNAALYLKRGGRLLFSTCTLEAEENENQLFAFLKKHSDFKLVPIDCSVKNSGYITLMPHKYDCDGFFISLMEKE